MNKGPITGKKMLLTSQKKVFFNIKVKQVVIYPLMESG